MILSDANPIKFWSVDCDTFNESDDFGANDACFCQPWECGDPIKTQFQDTAGQAFKLVIRDEDDIVLDTLNFNETSPGVYFRELTLDSNTPEICDKLIYFQIIKSGVVIVRSDCMDVKTNQDGTVLLEYSNYRNFAGLISYNNSPDLTFYLRVPAVFWEERFPETDEVKQLSNNRFISLNSQVKIQRKLVSDYLPLYFQLKIQLALKFQFLTIDGKDYIKEEPYERQDNDDRRFKLFTYSCWLTEKDYVVRNVL